MNMIYRAGNSVVHPERAAARWEEKRDFDGHNFLGRISRDQWTYETLYRSRRGRYYVVREIHREGVVPDVQFIAKEEAARWLILNEYPIPACLKEAAEKVSE
jgi:hypothetical protein